MKTPKLINNKNLIADYVLHHSPILEKIKIKICPRVDIWNWNLQCKANKYFKYFNPFVFVPNLLSHQLSYWI